MKSKQNGSDDLMTEERYLSWIARPFSAMIDVFRSRLKLGIRSYMQISIFRIYAYVLFLEKFDMLPSPYAMLLHVRLALVETGRSIIPIMCTAGRGSVLG